MWKTVVWDLTLFLPDFHFYFTAVLVVIFTFPVDVSDKKADIQKVFFLITDFKWIL